MGGSAWQAQVCLPQRFITMLMLPGRMWSISAICAASFCWRRLMVDGFRGLLVGMGG